MRIINLLCLTITSIISCIIGILMGIYVLAPKLDAIGWADALHVYRMEAEGGDPESQYYVGLYTLEGKGVKQNAEEAFYWISQSAQAECIQAQLKLAWMYETGTGVQEDKNKAIALYKEAAENAQKKLNLVL